MIEIRRILCPVDFSDFARHALEHAITLARWYESHLTLLHVYTMSRAVPGVHYAGPVVVEPLALSPASREQLGRDLQDFIQPVWPDDVPVAFEVVEGRAADQILDRAGTMPADLIVLGTHGRSGFGRLLLGSVTERVLRKASCPVLTVPPRAADAAALHFKEILCPVDFSDSSLRALHYALALAQEADAHLTVMHVLELLPEADVPELPVFNTHEYRERSERSACERLAAAIPEAARDYCVIGEVVTVGKAYREILRLAQERNAALITMGVRGRGTADLLLFGSTTQHVVRQAACPVLTLRT